MSDKHVDGSALEEDEHDDKKRQRTSSPSPHSLPTPHMPVPGATSSTHKPHAASGATGFTVPASPPRYVSMEEVMKAAHAVSNMKLAHEIATDEDFKMVPPKLPENSLESRVKEVMHKAFWDSLREKLREDPPDYSFALSLMAEVKQGIFELLLPQHQRLRAHIDEVLDMQLIEQQVDNETLDFMHYAHFVISIMARLCAPARDQQVAKLKEITDIPDLFKEIFAVLETLKMDMANFTIQQIRPMIQQQSVDYEKKKFSDLMKQQEEQNIDGLEFTKSWLQRSADKLYGKQDAGHRPAHDIAGTSSTSVTNTASTIPHTTSAATTSARLATSVSGASSASAATSASATNDVTPSVIMHAAFVELLQWDEQNTYPETMLMDRERLSVLCDAVRRLSVVATVTLITYNIAGASLASLSEFKAKLKQKILIIIGDVPLSDLSSHMLHVYDLVHKEVNEALVEHGYSKLSDLQLEALKDQIVHVTDDDNAVHSLIKSRILSFFTSLLSTSRPESVQFPAGMSALSGELNALAGHFLRLITHNRSVYGAHYANIIAAIINTRQYLLTNQTSSSHATTTTTTAARTTTKK